jgi:DNA-binding NarL/FixJ family response regulator
MRILIVDNHEIVRQGLGAIVGGRSEWDVCGEASTGGEAIEKARTLHPDIVLLDVTLPDMESAEVILEIRAVCPAAKIVALALTASGKLAAKALAAGASSLAMKSDTAIDFLKTLEHVANDEVFLSPDAVKLLRGELVNEAESKAMPNLLTPRELEILKLLAAGRTNRKVAVLLHISVKTVDVHRSNIMHKLKLITLSELIQFAIRHKLLEI